MVTMSTSLSPTTAAPVSEPVTTLPAMKRILIAEDNDDLRLIFSYALKADFDIQVAVNGKIALDMIYANPPDLLVLDINMPVMSGIDVIRALKSHAVPYPMKIVVVTGNAVAIQYEELDKADLVLMKPVSTHELNKLVTRLLS